MGFESAHAARRRLAMVAMTKETVHEALAPASYANLTLDRSGDQNGDRLKSSGCAEVPRSVAEHLEALAHSIVATPGAGGALLLAFAEQSRALSLVVEASARTTGAATLPAEVMAAVQHALRTPMPVGLELA